MQCTFSSDRLSAAFHQKYAVVIGCFFLVISHNYVLFVHNLCLTDSDTDLQIAKYSIPLEFYHMLLVNSVEHMTVN